MYLKQTTLITFCAFREKLVDVDIKLNKTYMLAFCDLFEIKHTRKRSAICMNIQFSNIITTFKPPMDFLKSILAKIFY